MPREISPIVTAARCHAPMCASCHDPHRYSALSCRFSSPASCHSIARLRACSRVIPSPSALLLPSAAATAAPACMLCRYATIMPRKRCSSTSHCSTSPPAASTPRCQTVPSCCVDSPAPKPLRTLPSSRGRHCAACRPPYHRDTRVWTRLHRLMSGSSCRHPLLALTSVP
jgi:hypothetical protein